MTKISFSITCFNEVEETKRLVSFLVEHKNPHDEIIVLWDNNGDPKIWEYLTSFEVPNVYVYQDKFQNHFADWKNKFFELSKGDYIYFLDADEMITEFALEHLSEVLESNPDTEMLLVPRVNIVKGIRLSDVLKWGWNISKLDNLIEEKEFDLDNPNDADEYELLKKYDLIIKEGEKIKFYTPIINKWDLQFRICKNLPHIRWKNRVHEQLEGFKTYSNLPLTTEWSLNHTKELNRQIKQNEYYSTL